MERMSQESSECHLVLFSTKPYANGDRLEILFTPKKRNQSE